MQVHQYHCLAFYLSIGKLNSVFSILLQESLGKDVLKVGKNAVTIRIVRTCDASVTDVQFAGSSLPHNASHNDLLEPFKITGKVGNRANAVKNERLIVSTDAENIEILASTSIFKYFYILWSSIFHKTRIFTHASMKNFKISSASHFKSPMIKDLAIIGYLKKEKDGTLL